ncbi:hypothetical protein [Paraprevotella clara]|jgi:hypothetical protein|uniref:hypothetical protein n=1 Tax=Paraprevotella clara TaxID=454154 RepID=UPI00241FD021|nr:hypothetical protein [Paraprevotella clara]
MKINSCSAMCKKYHKKYQILGLLFVLGECMNLFAQQPSPDNETFSIQMLPTQSQLPVANVHTVFQSSDGFFWYGTIGGGLCRDNGYQITLSNLPIGLDCPPPTTYFASTRTRQATFGWGQTWGCSASTTRQCASPCLMTCAVW